jgi:Uma2 family endonuclease
VPEPAETTERCLNRDELVARWKAMCADPTFDDIPGKIELTEWGEILMSPVSKTHGIVAMRISEVLHKALGGHTMGEVGIATSLGVRAPDVAWCSDEFLAAHPEEMPLSSAPEICVEIVSASNPLTKLREKAAAYLNAGAVEAWILFPQSRTAEIHGRSGRLKDTGFKVEIAAAFP